MYFSLKIMVACCCYSTELRELEAKLKAGYMNMERAAQIAEKDALKEKESVSVHSVITTMYKYKIITLGNAVNPLNTKLSCWNFNLVNADQFSRE